MSKQNLLYVHGLGGAGIRVASLVADRLNEAHDEGKAKVVSINMDTSDANKSVATGEVFSVESNSLTKEVAGSGSERRTNAPDIMESVKKYLDTNGLCKYEVGEFHILIASASGGSGSVILPYVAKELLSKGIPTMLMLIGDDKDVKSLNNTIATLKTIDKIAAFTNTSLLTKLGMNTNGWDRVNEDIVELAEDVSMFISGTNLDIDNEDMRIFFNQTLYKDLDIPKGVYVVKTVPGNLTGSYDYQVTNIRTLTTNNVTPTVDMKTLHSKSGKVILGDKSIARVEENKQISLISLNGALPDALLELENKATTLEKIKDNLKPSSHDGIDEDDLMVF